MLTGSELLAKVKELGDVSKSVLVRECGYVSTKKDGTEVMVDKTFVFKKGADGKLRLIVHKSSLPFESAQK